MRIILKFMLHCALRRSLGLAVLAVACGDDAPGSDGFETEAPTTYTFPSRFDATQPSVAYSGQTFRLVLVQELDHAIRELTPQIDAGTRSPVAGDVNADLDFFFSFDSSVAGGNELKAFSGGSFEQERFQDISSDKDLAGKIAGNDPVGQHEDWGSALIGWGPTGAVTPEGLVRQWFQTLDDLAVRRANNDPELGPDGTPVSQVFVTSDGLDLAQLTQKFLLGAMAYSQAADDYMDADVDGKGLLSPNTRDGQDPYTVLEHQWDEGFGYFGAARDYLDYTDEEIAGRGGRDEYGQGHHDADGNGRIDLQSEMNMGASVNAAKRDLGAVVSTNFSEQAMRGFLEGRHIISQAGPELTDTERAALYEARDRALDGWERALAATAIHYVNDTLQDMNRFGTADYDFMDHAKHWSELKGFALSLQFNPRAQISDGDLQTLHDLIGTAPVLPTADPDDIQAYMGDLRAARSLLGQAYGFATENLGDAQGEGGW